MKTKKSILGLLLALVVLVACGGTVFADDYERIERKAAPPMNQLIQNDIEPSMERGRVFNTGVDIYAFDYSTNEISSQPLVQYQWAGIPAADIQIDRSLLELAQANNFDGWYVRVSFVVDNGASRYTFKVDGNTISSGNISNGSWTLGYMTPFFTSTQRYQMILDNGTSTCWGNLRIV